MTLAALALAATVSAADPPGTPASRQALATCEQAQRAAPAEAEALLARGMEEAEAAIAADDADALAHFALFCNLGERMRRRGTSLRSAFELRRLRREIDRTLALAPDFSDALAGKGALLLDAPGLLGGDVEEAERVLRHAVAVDPGYLRPRFDLVRALERQGERAEARRQAQQALEIAMEKHDAKGEARARQLIAELAG